MKNNDEWNKEIRVNFNNAANNYSDYSYIQKHFCFKIVSLIKKLDVNNNKCFELGSGTGFLADEIERQFPYIKVCRIDFSEKMLLKNKKNSSTFLWDLNKGLPGRTRNSSLLVSNFCLHWLLKPHLTLRNWFDKLSIGGYLIVCLPTRNSFPEWRNTCQIKNIEYSGLIFPDAENLISYFKKDEIYFLQKYDYQENYKDVYKLLRNIIRIGAQATQSPRKTIKELRTLQNFWPKNKNNSVNLTWEIFILILKK